MSVISHNGKVVIAGGKSLSFDNLISMANETTGQSDITLTDAVQRLVDGYGQGGKELFYSSYSGLPYFEDMAFPDRDEANIAALNDVYRGCQNLKRLYCGKNNKFGTNCFNGCQNLKEAVLNCTCGSEHFWNCVALEKAVILEDCVFKTFTFDTCKNLMVVIIPENGVHDLPVSNIFIATSQFTTATGAGRIYVPRNQISAYESATNWSAYAGHYLAIEDYPEIATWEEWWK